MKARSGRQMRRRAKKPTATRGAAKKSAVKKPAAKKPAAKKPAAKKPAAKKPAAKKPAAKAKVTTPVSQFFTSAGGPWGKCFLPRAAGERRHWLVKSEPGDFAWGDLLRAQNQTTHWDGVRNHAARNFLRAGMRHGDLVFFYHSNADPSAIVGICEVVREAYPDLTALDPAHEGYDPDSSPAKPTWFMVDLRAMETLPVPVSLSAIKKTRALAQIALLRVGRLSVTPVTPVEWKTIVALARG